MVIFALDLDSFFIILNILFTTCKKDRDLLKFPLECINPILGVTDYVAVLLVPFDDRQMTVLFLLGGFEDQQVLPKHRT